VRFWAASDIAINPTDVVWIVRTTEIYPQLPLPRVFCSAMPEDFTSYLGSCVLEVKYQ